MRVETVTFNGRKYRRYPESSNKAHRRYFGRAGHRLHRDVWEHWNGPIPAGHHIHHRDGNSGNNELSNLELVLASQHMGMHKRQADLEHLARIRPLAAKWHKSKEGREFARTVSAKFLISQARVTKSCHFCRFCFKGVAWQKFCSINCKQKWRRKTGADNVEKICGFCGR